MDYNVDAIYVAGNYKPSTNADWSATIYRIGVPILNDGVAQGIDPVYQSDPSTAGSPPWEMKKMVVDTRLPMITAPFTVSADYRNDIEGGNVYLYGGTGRYLTKGDKLTNTQNYVFGIKDPFYNKLGVEEEYIDSLTCYKKMVDCPLSFSDLFYANPYTVKPGNVVVAGTGGVSTVNSWTSLLAEIGKQEGTNPSLQKYRGWYRKLTVNGTDPSERMVSKPTVFGGISLFAAYTPTTDQCGYGGNSVLYALYYETGTPFRKPVLGSEDNTVTIKDKMDLGYGIASSFGVHAAKESGNSGTVYTQMSTGAIIDINIIPAISIKSGATFWKEGR
jgi:type IV pilus assembly protein PilY1